MTMTLVVPLFKKILTGYLRAVHGNVRVNLKSVASNLKSISLNLFGEVVHLSD